MATGLLTGVVRHIRSAALLQDGGAMTDGQLLECFILQRDEAAFAALVRRHGPMVLGVCRRVLRHEQDAEDAFQATFLVLARKATAIGQRELVGNWLYGAAYRAALEVKAAKQRVKDRQVSAMPEPVVVDEAELWRDLRPVLDQELNGLPDKYRVPVVLCDLEGRTRRDVARQLGVPEGTLSGRLTTARRMLAKRLARHGLAISGASLAAVLTQQAASASVPLPLVIPTVQAASLLAAGQTAVGVVSAQVATVTEGVLKTMLMTKLKTVPVCIAVVALVVAGGGVVAERSLARGPAGQPVVAAEEPRARPAANHEPAKEKAREPGGRPKAGTTVAGTLQAVDAARNSVTVSVFSRKDGLREKTFQLARDARIQRDGKGAKLSDLKKGGRATLTFSEDQKTVVILGVASPPISARLKAVDGGKNTITITVGPRGEKQDKTYQLAKDARITIDGKDARLTDLKEGVTLSVLVDDADQLTLVRTRTARERKREE